MNSVNEINLKMLKLKIKLKILVIIQKIIKFENALMNDMCYLILNSFTGKINIIQ